MSKKFWIGVVVVFTLAFIAKKMFIADTPEELGISSETASLETLSEKRDVWRKLTFVDEFGEPSGDDYLTNPDMIKGSFSNSATNNSPLNVKFLISGPGEISIVLYEYARANPVKSYSTDIYNVQIKDREGIKHKLSGFNHSDRISFEKDDSWKIHEALINGGPVKFYIEKGGSSTTNYRFDIENTGNYAELVTTLN